MTSTTNQEFPLHTDEYFSATPARFVVLLCVAPSEQGGRSIVSYVDDFVLLLDGEFRELLSMRLFPSQAGPKQILTKGEFGWEITYNELELRRAAKLANLCIDPNLELALDALRLAANAAAHVFDLREGSCLLLNNKRALHGRTEFQKGDRRLLKRVRIK